MKVSNELGHVSTSPLQLQSLLNVTYDTKTNRTMNFKRIMLLSEYTNLNSRVTKTFLISNVSE